MITIVWNPNGFHMIQSLPKGIKWTGRYYSDNILSQIAARQNVGSHRKMIVYADNADPHVAKCVTEYVDHNSLKRTPHPPYSPSLAPSDSYLFGYVNYQIWGHEFTEGAELVSAISEILNQILTDTLVDVELYKLGFCRGFASPPWNQCLY
jgi:hypothetical protein